jgi:hypothetical protein
MVSRRLIVIKSCGWAAIGCSLLLFVLVFKGIGPDLTPFIAVCLLVSSILWWLKVVPAFCRRTRLEEGVRQYETAFKGGDQATGNEGILHVASLRLQPEPNRSVWLSEDDQTVGAVVGAYEMGRIWVTAIDSEERLVFQLRCANPGAWWHYGYKRKIRWVVAESDDERVVGVIELRPTFLGRFKWPISTDGDPKFGQVKAGVEWSRLMSVPAGAVGAFIIPNLKHHATVFMRNRPVCAVSWSGRETAVNFVPEECESAERKLAIGAAVLLANCPKYYRHA